MGSAFPLPQLLDCNFWFDFISASDGETLEILPEAVFSTDQLLLQFRETLDRTGKFVLTPEQLIIKVFSEPKKQLKI